MKTATEPETLHVLEQPVARLEKIVFALSEAARRQGEDRARILKALPAALSAECLRCGIQIRGEELAALARLPAAPELSARVQRLRDGTCARPECNYRFYRLILKKHPDVDWTKLLAPMATEPESGDPAQALCDATAARLLLHRASARRAVRVALVCAAAVVVLLVRQWYLGGRIPLIREPELFRVDVAAEELLLDP